MRFRPKKSTDQEQTEEAYQLLIALIERNQREIEPALWIGAMVFALADTFEKSEISFCDFKKAMGECIEHYKY